MKEILKRVPLINFRRNSAGEKIVPQPSPFVLRLDGKEERRLYIDEEITLDPGDSGEDEERITSFVIFPRSSRLILYTQRGPIDNPAHRQSAEWGYMNAVGITKNQEWTTTYTENNFSQEEGKKYVLGSRMYFDHESKSLHGPGWTLEYIPLTTN